MPHSIESLSRPFVNELFRPAGKTTKKETIEGGDVEFSFGSAGSNVFELRANSKGEVDNNDHQETKRTFDVVRVKNPDDNAQHVDVEVMTEYQAKNRIDESRIKVRFTPQAAAENIEILRRDQTRTTILP